jgi:hypothetical protein
MLLKYLEYIRCFKHCISPVYEHGGRYGLHVSSPDLPRRQGMRRNG